MGRSHYRLDKRQYQGIFKPGFFAHLNASQFWQTDNDPYQRSRKRRRKVFIVVTIVAFIVLIWVIIESSKALRLF